MRSKFSRKRRGVSPVIAVLLLIAIAVATGILVYVWVSGLAGALTSGGGGTQVSEQMSMDTYNFKNRYNATIVIRNSGSPKIILDRIYFDGNSVAIANRTTTTVVIVYRVSSLNDSETYNCSYTSSYYLSVIDDLSNFNATTSSSNPSGSTIKSDMTLDTEATLTLTITLKTSARPGSSHTIKIITADGAIFSFSVIAGRYS